MSFSPGQTIGNYRVLGRIGIGGMGEVYLAEHPLIGKRVALKVIHRELSSNREVVMRFFTEARASNKIGNDHIVEIHDFGQTEDGIHFFIMEYLDGKTLAQELAELEVVPVPRVLHIGAQIADALGAAHTASIIHRDLKPDNIMMIAKLGDPDFVKVLDFGLAKIFAETDAQLTGVGVVLGTPQYMSPEACESRPGVDHRTDIYSLGILLFQMLCGRVPFRGESMGEILVKQVAHPPPSPRGINPHIPPSVEQIVLRCLAKVPSQRFSTMGELCAALLDPEHYLASSPPIMPTAAPDQRTMLESERRRLRGSSAPPPVHPPVGAAPLHPGMTRPQTAQNHTMEIATPMGHSRHRSGRIFVMAALALVAVAVGAAIWTANPESQPRVANVAPDKHATIRLNTKPQGAVVLADDGKSLGTTPLKLAFPIDGQTITLRFLHPGMRERTKTLVATRDTSIELDLEALEPLAQRVEPGPSSPMRTEAAVDGASADAGPVAARPMQVDAAPARSSKPNPKRKPKPHKRPRRPTRAGDGTLAPDF